MRKIAGALSAVVLVSAAILTCKTVFVTQAVGMSVDGAVEQSAAAKIALRFPTETERFAAFMRPSDANRAALVLKGDRQPIAACSNLFSPQPTTDCLAGAKPAPVPSAAAPIAPRAAVTEPKPTAAEPVPTRVAVAIPMAAVAPIAAAAPVRAPAVAPPASCAQTLPTAHVRVERVLARIKDARTRQSTDACASYRSDFFDVVQAREVTALCRTGTERERELGRIDSAVEDINGAIAASCGT